MRRYRRSPRKVSKVCATEESKARALQVAWHAATDKVGTLALSEARKIVANPPICPYCQITIAFCCKMCNSAKGPLTGPEFTALMEFLADHLVMRMSVLQRLVAAGNMYRKLRWRR